MGESVLLINAAVRLYMYTYCTMHADSLSVFASFGLQSELDDMILRYALRLCSEHCVSKFAAHNLDRFLNEELLISRCLLSVCCCCCRVALIIRQVCQ